jgi:enoyl-CoA hydratase/carnithine racemase
MKFIHLEFNEQIAAVTLDHPTGNRINFQMREELLEAFERVAKSDVRALLIQGKGADFCLGGDIRDWPGIKATELRPVLRSSRERLIYSKPYQSQPSRWFRVVAWEADLSWRLPVT